MLLGYITKHRFIDIIRNIARNTENRLTIAIEEICRRYTPDFKLIEHISGGQIPGGRAKCLTVRRFDFYGYKIRINVLNNLVVREGTLLKFGTPRSAIPPKINHHIFAIGGGSFQARIKVGPLYAVR